MGSIRTLLALAVVLEHTVGGVIVGGMLAVQLFYMISGYLMSLILTEGGAYKSNAVFYRNRLLRLYPMYFVVAGLTLALHLLIQTLGHPSAFWDIYQSVNTSTAALLATLNVTLFGQDWVMFMAYNGDTLSLAKDFGNSEVLLYQGLLVPQAWTLGIEISFYLIAPFVLRRPKLLLTLLAGSLALRVWLVAIGIGLHDPWSHRFFPTELALFLLGAVSHQWVLPLVRKHISLPLIDRIQPWAVGFIMVFCLILLQLPYPFFFQGVIVGCFILLMPFLFAFQNRHKWDNAIGDISYPLYICHIFVIIVVSELLGMTEGTLRIILIIAGSFALAIALERYINKPVERLRRSIKHRAEQKILASEQPGTA